MSKGFLGFFSIFIALLMGAIYYTDAVQSPFVSVLNGIKSNYHSATEFVQNKIERHFFQADHIAELEEKLQKYEKSHILMQQLASEVNDLYVENNSSLSTNSIIELVRTISYQKFGDLNRVWLEINDYNSSRVYGLIHKEFVAGIVIAQNERALGLLNSDTKSSFSVYVGNENAPGIVHGNNSNHLVVKFIPAWFLIQEGDEVITSGLDEIFFKGLKVGKVISVTKSQGYQTAAVEPYYKANNPNYFHIIKKVR